MTWTLGLGGDFYVERVEPSAPLRGSGLDDCDLVLANLEGPFSSTRAAITSARAAPTEGFLMAPDLVADLAGVDAVSIANNHALDYGTDAYLESISVLDAAGIAHAGGGQDQASAHAPVLLQAAGTRVAFLAYTCLYQAGWAAADGRPGMATLKVLTSYEPPARVFEQPGTPPTVHTWLADAAAATLESEVAAARAIADFVVVSVHWGVSKRRDIIADYQREIARRSIRAGAGVVFGHHPHTLQSMEVIEGRPVFYSLGNLVFDKDFLWPENEAAIIRLHLDDDRVTAVGIVPLMRDGALNPVPADAETGQRIKLLMTAGLGDSADGIPLINNEFLLPL
jgi:poly-gamma-glutamate synthesis protein (capsule biosynthesis protein)